VTGESLFLLVINSNVKKMNETANTIGVLGSQLGDSFQNIGSGVGEYLPKIIIAILILVVGWVVGAVVGKLIAKIIEALKVDQVLQSAGAEDVVTRAGFKLDSGAFIGGLVKWFIIVVFLVASFDILGLVEVNKFMGDVVLNYLPNVIVAVLILIIAAVIADSLKKIVAGGAKAATGVGSAHLIGVVAHWSVWIFAIIIAFAHLGVAPDFMLTLFTGFVAMLALAGGLAFGLGGKDAAAEFIAKIKSDVSSHRKS